MKVKIAIEPVDQPEALALISELDAHLQALYPPKSRHGLTVAELRGSNILFVLARDEQDAAHGCGAVALLDGHAELKRMFVRPVSRGLGVADAIVAFLEREASNRGYGVMRLETGLYQTAALSFYARLGYARRDPFGAYRPDPLCVFMEKRLAG